MTLDHTFEGMAILCFYPSNQLFQGHCINATTNDSPYSFAGKLNLEHVDPQHNDCMDPDDFYNVLIQSHTQPSDNISLLLRRPKHNDAGGLSTHEHEQEINGGYEFLFETHQFFSGNTALAMKRKYFPSILGDDEQVLVCIGDVKFHNTENYNK